MVQTKRNRKSISSLPQQNPRFPCRKENFTVGPKILIGGSNNARNLNP